MSEVTIKINNRGFGVSCDAGQEQRLIDLGHYVDSRLRQIASAGAASNESHLMVLTALVLADEIYDLREQVEYYKQQAAMPQDHVQAENEAYVAEVIEHLAGKIANISDRLKRAA